MSVFISRIVAAVVAGLCSWLLVHFGVTVDAEEQAKLAEHLVGIAQPVGLVIYAVVHKLLSKKTNPGDAASHHLADRESAETAQLKARSGFHGV